MTADEVAVGRLFASLSHEEQLPFRMLGCKLFKCLKQEVEPFVTRRETSQCHKPVMIQRGASPRRQGERIIDDLTGEPHLRLKQTGVSMSEYHKMVQSTHPPPEEAEEVGQIGMVHGEESREGIVHPSDDHRHLQPPSDRCQMEREESMDTHHHIVATPVDGLDKTSLVGGTKEAAAVKVRRKRKIHHPPLVAQADSLAAQILPAMAVGISNGLKAHIGGIIIIAVFGIPQFCGQDGHLMAQRQMLGYLGKHPLDSSHPKYRVSIKEYLHRQFITSNSSVIIKLISPSCRYRFRKSP